VEIVRVLFKKYLELGTLRGLIEWTRAQGIKMKAWKKKDGNMKGGNDFHIARLHWLLTRKVYIGMLEHHRLKKVYPGQHEAIIDKEIFEAVQAQLGCRYGKNEQRKKYLYSLGLFHGKLYTAKNEQFGFTNSKKAGRRFNYYYTKGTGGTYLSVEQIDAFAVKAINKILDFDFSDWNCFGQDIKMFLKKISALKQEHIKVFLNKSVYIK
jgi:hypothetical protein